MKNKRATFFMLYLAFMTFFMCCLALSIYIVQQKNLANSFVSPAELLELKDKQNLAEIQEKNIILASARIALCEKFSFENNEFKCSENQEFGSKEFERKFREKFFFYLLQPEQEQFRNFLFSDFKYKGQEIKFEDLDESGKQNFFNDLYSMSFDENNLIVKRNEIEKLYSLKASERDKINFAIDVNYKYSKEYKLTKEEIENGLWMP
ncbi:MAG: hypothetical protein ACOYT4_04380 [Nanoarchaeota archaeon]